MSRQCRKHLVAVDREGKYKAARRIAYGLGYKHQPRWRKTHLKGKRMFLQFEYSFLGPYTVGARRKESNMLKLVSDPYGNMHIYYNGIEQPQWLAKERKE